MTYSYRKDKSFPLYFNDNLKLFNGDLDICSEHIPNKSVNLIFTLRYDIQLPDPMTEACLVDHLKQNLVTIRECKTVTGTEKIYDNRKYYNQAHNLLKIGAFKPVPYFIIHLSDLYQEIIVELYKLDHRDRAFVLKQAVGRIFEDVNFKLYHNSISRVLKVKLQK